MKFLATATAFRYFGKVSSILSQYIELFIQKMFLLKIGLSTFVVSAISVVLVFSFLDMPFCAMSPQ